ncbi:fructose-bisphosphatase class II [Fervidobacterium thailandense]|uniref:fructose-bisphosphatase n=1 Tax=Fervidobacterium thailandense TaxID=1008305 RepID=A0A1E3G1H4_9BACT|nr:fructose-bisphosphatase class II [Fervidobacterium thailandense]ODN30119.1 hypothetical protein A4H02_07400 [Fervidobacterium thailandense]
MLHLVEYRLRNAISVSAATEKDGLSIIIPLINKPAVEPELAGKLDLNASIRENLRVAAAILVMEISELTCVVLNRDSRRQIINEIRRVGARIKR